MSYMRMNFTSQALSACVDVSIVMPTGRFSYFPPDQPRHHIMPGKKMKPQYQAGMKFQTVYVIQAGMGDDSYLMRTTNLERYAEENCVMLVIPSISNSFGVDTAYGVEYSAFITDELPVIIQTLFASSGKREDNFIMGCAAGGNAAVYNAVRHPEKYLACADLSGGIGVSFDLDKMKASKKMTHFALAVSTFPEELDGTTFDLADMTRKHIAAGTELPQMFFIRGSEEGRIGEAVEKDAEIAASLGYTVFYDNVQGGMHNAAFWDAQFERLLGELLPLKREPVMPE